MLHTMKAKNPGMSFKYIPKPEIFGPNGRKHFFYALCTFKQCIKAFKNCCDVLSIDCTFLTEKYEDTFLSSIGGDVLRSMNEIGNTLVVLVGEPENESVLWHALELTSCKIMGLCRLHNLPIDLSFKLQKLQRRLHQITGRCGC
jgi:hypothetical protein